MEFAVTYRDRDGAIRTECIEAKDRADCFAKCKERGIVPVGVDVQKSGKEGCRRHSASGRNAKFQIWGFKPVLLLSVVLAIGIAMWLWTQGGGTNEDRSRNAFTEKANVKKKPAVRNPEAKAVSVVTNTVAVTNATVKVVKAEEVHKTVSIHTNNLGKIVEKWIDGNGRKRMSVKYARKPVFDNASDDQLAMAVGGGGTQAIAPIPMTEVSENEFLKSLERPIVISEDDSVQVKQLKAAVRDAREAMKQMMDEGKSYKEALAEHQKLVNENVETRNECMAELKRLVDAGDQAGAEDYLRTMNVALEQMGIPAMTMPKSREELNAAREMRRRERQGGK